MLKILTWVGKKKITNILQLYATKNIDSKKKKLRNLRNEASWVEAVRKKSTKSQISE